MKRVLGYFEITRLAAGTIITLALAGCDGRGGSVPSAPEFVGPRFDYAQCDVWSVVCNPANNMECGDAQAYRIFYCPSFLGTQHPILPLWEDPWNGGIPTGNPTADTITVGEPSEPMDEPDIPGAPERINGSGFILKNTYWKTAPFKLDFTDQHLELHIFEIDDAVFSRNNLRPTDRGLQGWEASYRLQAWGAVRASIAGERIHWVLRIPIRSTLVPLNQNDAVGAFYQYDKIYGQFIRFSY